MFLRIAAMVSLATLSAPVAAQGLEAQQSFHVDYSVSILGLNVGRSTFKSTIDGNAFRVSGTLSSSGIARIFDSTEGTTEVSGSFGPALSQADSYRLNYTSGNKKKRTEISFANGQVTRTENVPPLKKRNGKWKELNVSDLVSVTDPISATMVRASSMEDVCNRTLKVYDGEMRADLRLSFVRIAPAEARGYSGDAVTCQAKFVPVSGYREDHRSILFLKNKGKISIAFAPLGTTGVYAPIRVSAATEIGTLVVAARRFEEVH